MIVCVGVCSCGGGGGGGCLSSASLTQLRVAVCFLVGLKMCMQKAWQQVRWVVLSNFPVTATATLLPADHIQIPTCLAATKSINRFALVRKLSSDPTGLFLSPLWDGAARRWEAWPVLNRPLSKPTYVQPVGCAARGGQWFPLQQVPPTRRSRRRAMQCVVLATPSSTHLGTRATLQGHVEDPERGQGHGGAAAVRPAARRIQCAGRPAPDHVPQAAPAGGDPALPFGGNLCGPL